MNTAALKGYDEIIKAKVGELMDALAQRQSQIVDISEWMSYFGCVDFYLSSHAKLADKFAQVRFYGPDGFRQGFRYGEIRT